MNNRVRQWFGEIVYLHNDNAIPKGAALSPFSLGTEYSLVGPRWSPNHWRSLSDQSTSLDSNHLRDLTTRALQVAKTNDMNSDQDWDSKLTQIWIRSRIDPFYEKNNV